MKLETCKERDKQQGTSDALFERTTNATEATENDYEIIVTQA